MRVAIHSLTVFAVIIVLALAAGGSAEETGGVYTIKSTLPIGGDGGWDYVRLDDAGKLLFVPRSTHTQVFDLATGKQVADIAGNTLTHGVALVPEAGRGFISDGKAKCVTVFDLKTFAVLGKVDAPLDADGIIYDDASKRVMVVSGDEGVLIPIDPSLDLKQGKADAAIELGGAPEYLAADGKGRVFVNLQDKNEVAVVDTKAMKVIARWPTAPGGAPTGMSIDRAKHRLYLGCRDPQKLVVMSTDDGKVIADLPIGPYVDATAVDGPYVLASCGGDGTLTVARETSPGHYEVVQTLKTSLGARTMAVDSRAGKVYLVTADMQEVAPTTANPHPRPRTLPGTFKLIIAERTARPTTQP